MVSGRSTFVRRGTLRQPFAADIGDLLVRRLPTTHFALPQVLSYAFTSGKLVSPGFPLAGALALAAFPNDFVSSTLSLTQVTCAVYGMNC